jgi:cell division GTPase FtsZ
MDIIRSRVAEDANIIFGTCYDKSLEGSVHVSIIVSGIQTDLISPPVHSMESTTGKPTIGNIGGNRMNTSTATKTTVSTEREEAVIESQRTLFSRLFSL